MGSGVNIAVAACEGRTESECSERQAAPGALVAEASRLGAKEVILCWPNAEVSAIISAVRALTQAGFSASVLSPHLAKVSRYLPVRTGYLAGYPRLTFAARPRGALSAALKRAVDYAVSILTLLIAAPLLALFVPLLFLLQGGPVFFRQERVGHGGKKFLMYKLRTMFKKDAWPAPEELNALNVRRGPMFKAPNDPRVTKAGKWLRRLCLDEIPQLLNVLTGEMSLVGARPPLPSEVARYGQGQLERLGGYVGMTGLWQISNRAELDFDDVVFLDLYYDRNRGLLMDLKILMATFGAILSGRATS